MKLGDKLLMISSMSSDLLLFRLRRHLWDAFGPFYGPFGASWACMCPDICVCSVRAWKIEHTHTQHRPTLESFLHFCWFCNRHSTFWSLSTCHDGMREILTKQKNLWLDFARYLLRLEGEQPGFISALGRVGVFKCGFCQIRELWLNYSKSCAIIIAVYKV